MQTMDCFEYEQKRPGYRNAVTHVSREPKVKVEVMWEPPQEDFDDLEVVFRYSLVENFRTFWADLRSEETLRPLEQGGRKFPIYDD